MDRSSTWIFNELTGNKYANNGTTNGRKTAQNSSDNFFTKRARSIDNAIGTTGAALYETGGNLLGATIAGLTGGDYTSHRSKLEQEKTENLLKDNQTRMNNIAKKYGYNTYHDVWDARDVAEANGDTETLNKIDNIISPELQAQANANVALVDKNAAEYKDYMQNNDVSKRINQDRGKFLGSAMNTLSTATDVLGLTNGPLSNAVQGAWEGVADELEQNGLENFSAERAGQNALTGAATGAVTGLVNKGVSNALAKRGGNLFKGGNKLTQALNDAGSKTAIGRIGSTLATGAGRGAISGAVGGATGAGLQSALQGADIGTGISNALQGAVQGAGQGATTGAIMAGANMAIDKTPIVGDTLRKVNQAQQDWKNSGNNYLERLSNTWENDNSAVARLIKNPGETLSNLNDRIRNSGAGNIGNTIQDASSSVPAQEEASNYEAPREPINQQKALDQSQAWDNLAKESGYASYDDMAQKFAQANPGVEVSAENVLDWADKTNAQPYAVMQQEAQDVEGLTSKTSKESKLKYAQGQELLKQYGSIDQPMARSTEAAKTFQELSEMGFTKPGDVERMANAITGSNGAVSKLTKSVIETAKPVNTFNGIKDDQTIDEFIDSSITKHVLNGLPEGKAIKTSLSAALNSLPSRVNGSVTFEDSAIDTFKTVQELEALSAELKGKGGSTYHRPDRMDLRQAKVVDDVANLLKDRIYDGADVRAALTPEVAQSLKAFDPNNKAWGTTVDDFVANAKTPKDLRSFQKPWVNASRYIDNQYIQAATAGGRVSSASDLLSNVPVTKAGLVKQVANAVVNSAPAHRAKAKFYGYLANKAGDNGIPTSTASGDGSPTPTETAATTTTNSNNAYSPSTQLYNAIGRTEGAINRDNAKTAQYLSEVAQEAETVPNTLESLATTGGTGSTSTSLYNAVNGSQSVTPGFNSLEEERQVYFFRPTGDKWTDMLSRAMRRAKNAEDYDALDSLYEMYQDAISKNSTSSTAKTVADLSATQQAQLAKLDSADSAIDELESLFNKAGGGKGPIAGNLQSIAGDWGWDPNARTYNQLSEGLVNQIALAIGKTDSLNTEGEVKRALQLIPQLTDDATTAKNKLEELRRMLATTKASYNTAYGLTA